MAIILTEHAKQRIELRGCPDPTKVRVKKATDKDTKQNIIVIFTLYCIAWTML